MGTLVYLKPRSTVVFENGQKSRFAPDEVSQGIIGAGTDGVLTFSADATTLEDADITRHNLAGGAHWALRVLDDVAVVDNGSYTLTNDGVVSSTGANAAFLAVVLIDPDDSITNYVVTINGTDETDSPVSDMITFPGTSKVQFTTNRYKTVTSISGGVITGANAGDSLRVVPRIADNAYSILTRAHDPYHSNNERLDDAQGGNNDKGAYLQCISTSDREVRVSFPPLPPEVVEVIRIRIIWNTKNLAATTNGIQCFVRVNGTNYVQSTDTTTSTDTGISHSSGTITLSVSPDTSAAWTLAEINTLELGVVFKGDSPTVTKQAMSIRYEMDVHTVAQGVPASITDPKERALAAINSVSLFDESANNDSAYCAHDGQQNERIGFKYQDLPAEALSVTSVKGFWRGTYFNPGHPNGVTENTDHCALGGTSGAAVASVQPRGGDGSHYGRGPLEQSNLGGIRFAMSSLGGSIEYLNDNIGAETNGRILIGPGNPSDGCGFGSGAASGQNDPWGTYHSRSKVFTATPTIGNPWTVARFNTVETFFEIGGREDKMRYSKVYVEPEWTRSPTGEVYFHLAVDDDPASPDDTKYMSSQHPNNKRFGVDFAGIEEVTAVNGLTGFIRGWKQVGATKGWKAKLNINGTDYEHPDGEQHNTSPETKSFTWLVSPATGDPFTRDEVNSAVLIWEAQGENDYYPKFVSLMGLQANIDPIPAKIDTARRLGSEVLLFQGKPVPYLQVRVPFVLGDAKLMREIAVSHDAIPKVEQTLGFERWERSLLRIEEKAIDHDTDTFIFLLRDLRDVLRLLEFSGQAVTKGRSFDGMSIITPGVNPSFVRGTNDYQPDPFADIIQELKANEPPTNLEGILIQNRGTNRIINSAFSQGATDVFDNYTKVGLPAAGASIVEDPTTIYDDEAGVLRSVLFTGATTPADIYLEQDAILPTGDALTPEGGRHTLTITHEDIDGQPLSMWLRGKPVGFSENNFNPGDDSWATGNPTWFTLPVRSTPTRDRIYAPFATLHDVAQTAGFRDNLTVGVRFGVRTSANQRNRVYDLQIEGGTIVSGEELAFPRSRILTKTGPVVRDEAELSIPNRAATPVYYTKRGTGFCIIETLWNSSELPQAVGIKRYVFGLPLTAGSSDALYYDADNEQFVFERILGGTSYKATFFYPQVSAGIPIRLAWRWISVEGDRDETPFSIQLYVDDVRGTDASPGQALSQPSLSNLYIGSFDGTNGQMLDGRIRRLKVSQEVLTLSRIKKLR